jgi:flavin-dependent dehydrogenase
MTAMERSIDVAILGGGLAGNFMARQLRLDVPSVSVAMFEKTGKHNWKVGESTVEIASNYMVRKLGLSTYLHENHLPKMGLRFFFDTPEKNADLLEMSEIGTDRSPSKPSFQLDRARIEADLRVMNANDGVDVNIGWSVKNIELGKDGERHRFTVVSDDGEERTYNCRWLLDATGRNHAIGRKLDLVYDEPVHHLSSVYARYTGVRDMDQIKNDPWRRRAGYISRYLSTNHFCYPGYWIWFIPLSRGVMSVGVVGEKHIFKKGMRTAEGFKSFIDEHGAPRWLMETASEPMDIQGFTQLAYGIKQYFSDDRWGLLGDAGAFADPFYSPGSDFISTACDYMTDLIRRDAAGETRSELAERRQLYNDYMLLRWESTMLIYRNLYPTFGSYDILRVKFNFDLGCYLNVLFDVFALDQHLDLRYLRAELRRQNDQLVTLRNFSALFQECVRTMKANGTYYRNNLGQYNRGIDCVRPLLDEIATPRKKIHINRRTEEIFNYGREEAMKLLDRSNVTPLKLHEFAEAPFAP